VIDLALVTGLALDSQNGLNESIELTLTTGQALNTLPGLRESIELVLDAGEAIGDVQVGGVAEAIELALTTGPGSVASALGINEAIDLVLAGGAASGEAAEPEIGDAYGGGYFAGYISHTADGVATHRLIVAPATTGATGTGYALTTNLQYRTANTGQIASDFDGAANTAAMVGIGINLFPAAQFCVGLNIGGYTDWYLPARLELEIAYSNLKPSTSSNNTSWGINAYSVPAQTANYTSGDPGQTSVVSFQSGQPEAFVADAHWSSTSNGTPSGWLVSFNSGGNVSFQKTSSFRLRAFRREAI
jgi:hypothetical protein